MEYGPLTCGAVRLGAFLRRFKGVSDVYLKKGPIKRIRWGLLACGVMGSAWDLRGNLGVYDPLW